MLTSTPTSPKKAEPKSFLFIGPPGGGKTTLAMQFPGVCFLDCDRNLDGPEDYLRHEKKENGRIVRKSLMPDLAYSYVPITYDEAGKPIPTDECYDKLILELCKLKSEDSIKAIAIDGLTHVNEFIIQKVLKEQRIQTLETRHWDHVKSSYMRLLYTHIRNTGKTSIVTCHEKAITKADSRNMMEKVVVGYQPFVQSGVRDAFGGLFTDVWRCTSELGAGQKVEFRIQTIRDTKSDLKNSMSMPAEIVIKDGELAYEKIKPYLQ